jgi:hypothetical protein
MNHKHQLTVFASRLLQQDPFVLWLGRMIDMHIAGTLDVYGLWPVPILHLTSDSR